MATVKVMKNKTKKITVQEEVEETVCDICGAVADGEWSMYSNLNGNLWGKWHLRIDACKKHASIFNDHFFDYRNHTSEEQIAELIEKMKAFDIENREE